MKLRQASILLLGALALHHPAAVRAGPQISLGPASPSDSFVVTDIQHAPGDISRRLFVVFQDGRIRILRDYESSGGTYDTNDFLDISSLVRCCSEMGLLGLAFHPDYQNNGLFYVSYYNTSNSE